MTNYVKSTNFATKDTLTSGDPLKIVKGTEINTEFDNIATAVNSKSDAASPTFTGTVTAATLSVIGTSTLTGVATLTAQPILSSLTASKPVFTDASKGLVSTGTLGADQGGTGVVNNAAMTVTGSGNFAYTRTLTGTTNVTFPTTGTLATLAGSETFTNKTLTSPAIGGTPTGVGVLTSGTAQASTSGTSVNFTGIPSWAKRITVMFNGVSTNGSTNILIQIGSGSIQTAGYVAGASALLFGNFTPNGTSSTAGFPIFNSNTASVWYGSAVLTLHSSNMWTEIHSFSTLVGNQLQSIGSGGVTLSGALDLIKISASNGTDLFDSGSINILYE